MSFKIPCGGFKLDEKSFSLDKNDVLSIPKPLTYDYMPEGYPKKDEEVVTTDVDITWDGNTSGLVASSMNHMYRVSDAVYTLGQFKKMNYVSYGDDISVASFIDSGGLKNSNGLITVWAGEAAPIIVTEEAVVNESSLSDLGGAPDTFTEPGVYFPADGCVTRLYSPEPIVETATTIEKLNEEFLPYEVMKANNPVGKGSFSMNRKPDSDIGSYSFAEGRMITASGDSSHAEGQDTIASGGVSHAEGQGTIASGDHQHVQGVYNIEDGYGVYIHIVGNGLNSNKRSNAHTLDWSGNAWFAGTVEGTAVIVKSSTAGSSKKFKITVDDSGTISAAEVT